VHGTVTGKLTATEIIDIRRDARVQAQVAAPRLALEEGGTVNGRIETRSVDAAVRVAQYRNQK
jgi:cytoskeletal protein CcmA (bactofilin family)